MFSVHEEDRERKCSLIFSSDSTILIPKEILKSIEVTIYSMQCTHIFIYIYICIHNMYNIDKYLRKKKKRIATFVYLHNGSVVLHSFFTLSSVSKNAHCTFFFFFSFLLNIETLFLFAQFH